MPKVTEPFTVVERGATSSHQVYDDYVKSYSGQGFDPDVQLRAWLRKQYPNHILTVVPENNVSLLHYAAAGNAHAKLDLESDNAIRFRGYIRGAQPGTGAMAESIRFAKYEYLAMEQEFIFYTCQQGFYIYQYILKEPIDGEIITGNSKLTDALLAAIGEFQRPEPIGDDIVYVYDGYWRASKELYKQVQNASWNDVILDESMKKALTDIVKKFFDSKDVYDDLGVPWKRGVLFHGPAGNGKTISIKALMHTLHDRKIPVPSLYVKAAPSTYNIRQVFMFARQMAPCMLVLEDIDTIVTRNTRSYFFNEVDGLENNDGIMMVGSTNHLDQLDPGLSKRPSRFDRKYLFPLPDTSERVKYCMFWRDRLQKKDTAIAFPKKLCQPMAEKMQDFSFAYMKEAFVATLLSIANNHTENTAASASLRRKLRDDGDKNGDDGLEDYELWREFLVQVKILRDDMDSSAKDEDNDDRRDGGLYVAPPSEVPPHLPGMVIDPFGRLGVSEPRIAVSIEGLEPKIMPKLERMEINERLEEKRPARLMARDNEYLTFWKDDAFGELQQARDNIDVRNMTLVNGTYQ